METLRIDNLKQYADLAYDILENNTDYKKGKKIISEIFRFKPNNKEIQYYDIIILRLTVIDSYYSTQMNKRLFGIEDIAKKIREFKTDDFLKKQCEIFLDNPTESNSDISRLFEDKFGIHKNGKESGQAASLISKYLYFLMDYKFPIFDSLAIESYKTLIRYNNLNLKRISNRYNPSYFENIKTLNLNSNINDYNKLDNFLWLTGKINNGSFSLILNKEKYKEFIKVSHLDNEIERVKKELKENNKKNKRIINDAVSKFLNDNNTENIFEGNLSKFIQFSIRL